MNKKQSPRQSPAEAIYKDPEVASLDDPSSPAWGPAVYPKGGEQKDDEEVVDSIENGMATIITPTKDGDYTTRTVHVSTLPHGVKEGDSLPYMQPGTADVVNSLYAPRPR